MKPKKLILTSDDGKPPIPQASIDPRTNRYCATLAEISRDLGMHPYQVTKCNPRRYRKKYLDVMDVINARKSIAGPGRPRNGVKINSKAKPSE